jgi:hypothetical protein
VPATAPLAFAKLWCDSGFKRTFIEHCRHHHVVVEVVKRIHPARFEVLPKRWIVERIWSWPMNSRRLQVDYERDPIVTEGSIWLPTAATSCADSPSRRSRGRAGKQSRQSLKNRGVRLPSQQYEQSPLLVDETPHFETLITNSSNEASLGLSRTTHR